MTTTKHQEFEQLRAKILAALDVLQQKGLPADEAMPEMVKFIVGLSIKAIGPQDTLDGMHDLVDQLDGLFLPVKGSA